MTGSCECHGALCCMKWVMWNLPSFIPRAGVCSRNLATSVNLWERVEKDGERIFLQCWCVVGVLANSLAFYMNWNTSKCSLGCSNIGCSLPMQVQSRCIRQVTCGDRVVFMLLCKDLVKDLEMELQCTVVRLWKWLECRLAVFGQFCRSEQATWTVRANSLPCCLSPSAWETVTRAACAWQWCCPASPHRPRRLWRCHRPSGRRSRRYCRNAPGCAASLGKSGTREPPRSELGWAAEFSKAAVAGQPPWTLATRHRIGTVCWASCPPVCSHWAPWKWFGKHHR